MGEPKKPLEWSPFTIAETALASSGDTGDPDLSAAWSQLFRRLEAAPMVESEPASSNRTDVAAGFRQQLVPLTAGIDEARTGDFDRDVLRERLLQFCPRGPGARAAEPIKGE